MGYRENYVAGEFPDSGAIFMSNSRTKKECFRRKLFGLPIADSDFVLRVEKGMTLFLFEFERRQLHGVFRATSNGEINIEPNAFRSSGKQFPAQVCFTPIFNSDPLDEHEFREAIRDNYYSLKKFKFGLSEHQVSRLIMMFESKRMPKRHPERYVSPEDNGRFRDHRRKRVRHRTRFIKKEDNRDEIKEVDYQVNSTRKRNRTDMVARVKKDNRDDFFTNYTNENDDFSDYGSNRHALLDKRIDHSLVGLRNVTDADLHFRDDIIVGHEIRGITNNDRFYLMEKIKSEHDIEDNYRQSFTESHGKHFGKDIMDDNRIKTEYEVIKGFRRSLSDRDLEYDRGNRMINDELYYGHGTVESEIRSFNEHPTYKPIGTAFGIKPDDDEKIAHDYDIPFSHSTQNISNSACNPYEFSDIEGPYDSGIPYSTSYDTTTNATIPISYDSEIPIIPPKTSSCYNSSPIDNCPIYQNPEIPTLPMIKPLPYCPQTESPMPYFDDCNMSYETRDSRLMDGIWIFKKNSREHSVSGEGSYRSHDVASKRKYVREEDPIHPNKLLQKPRENKHVDDCDKRVSVFSRLTSASKTHRHEEQEEEKEAETNEKHDLEKSVDKVMTFLEKVVSCPVNKTEKSDDSLIDAKVVDMESDADVADEEIEGGLVLQETRLVDFKRRKKANVASDVECEIETGVGSDAEFNCLTGLPCKRRKLVRPEFVRNNKSTVEGADDVTDIQLIARESVSMEQVETSVKEEQLPAGLQFQPSVDEGEDCPESQQLPPGFQQSVGEVEECLKVERKSEQLPAGFQQSVGEREECPKVEEKSELPTGCHKGVNEENVFVEGRNWKEVPQAGVALSENNQKMCGWIEW